MSDIRSTITTGGASQLVSGRSGGAAFNRWQIRNESSGDLYASDYQDPSGTVGILIKPGEAYLEDKPIGGALRIWGGTTGQAFSARVW